MRAIPALLLLCLAVSAGAREWKSEIFHCAANIPDAPGWQMIDAPPAPGIAPVLVMQNPAKGSVFGIGVVEKFQGANLADPNVQRGLEAMLQQFGYRFAGHSVVRAAGFDWLQYPVHSGESRQTVSGIIRYATAGGYLFSITMLKGGGPEAAQDSELQQAAGSFRILPGAVFPVAGVSQAPNPPSVKSADAPVASVKEAKPADAAESADGADNSQKRMIWYGVAGVVVLLLFFSIIGSGSAKKS